MLANSWGEHRCTVLVMSGGVRSTEIWYSSTSTVTLLKYYSITRKNTHVRTTTYIEDTQLKQPKS